MFKVSSVKILSILIIVITVSYGLITHSRKIYLLYWFQHSARSLVCKNKMYLLGYIIALDKTLFFFNKKIWFFYFSMKTFCGYSLEVHHWGTSNDWGTSNEYPQHIVFMVNSEKIVSSYNFYTKAVFYFCFVFVCFFKAILILFVF